MSPLFPKRGGRIAVLLPASGHGVATAVHAAGLAVAAGTDLVVAATVPSPHPLEGWAPSLPYLDLRLEFELDMMTRLTAALSPTGVRWDLVLVRNPRAELPDILRDAGVATIFVHVERKRWPLSARERRTATTLTRRTTIDVRLIRRYPPLVRGTHSQDHTVVPFDGGRRAD
jgi:hypothetical protein